MELEGRNAHLSLGAGKKMWILDSLVTFKLTGEDTNGEMALIETLVPPESGPPPHLHEREDEVFYIVEGEFEFLMGDKRLRASSGSVVYGPKGTAHTYKNVGPGEGRFLATIIPAGFEHYFREVGEPAEDAEGLSSSPEVTPERVEKLLGAASGYGLKFLLPEEQ